MSIDSAVASNWVLEKFSAAADGFNLLGTARGYASFSRAFQDGTTVFYAASDDDGNREAGWGVYRGNRIVDRTPTATLTGTVYNDKNPSPLPFNKGGQIGGTFNALAFNTLWNRKGAGMVISATEPTEVETGMQWLDSTTAKVWIWDEDKWLEFPVTGSGGVGSTVQIEEWPPTAHKIGDTWVDYGTTGELYVWDGRFWVSMTGDGGPKVIIGDGEGGLPPDVELPENITFDQVESVEDFDQALARFIDPSNKGKWGRIKTSDILTNPEATFRDAKGRFKSTKDYEGLTDQLKVNRFLAGEIESLSAEIDGIEFPETDLSEYAKTEDVDAAVEAEKLERSLADIALRDGLKAEIDAIEIPEVDLDGYATEDWVADQLQGPTQDEKIAAIEAQIQFRGLMDVDADGKPVWPADQTKDRGGWWAYPSSKFSSTWKYENLEWIFPLAGEVGDVTKQAAPTYEVGDIIQMQISNNEAGAGTSWQYLDTAPVYVEYKVEEVYYPNTQAGNENKYKPAYRVSKSAPDHRYTGSLPNVVKGPEGDPSDAWIQWYPTTFAFGAVVPDGDFATKEYVDDADQQLQGEIEQIALGLEALLTQRTVGQWAYDGTVESGPPRTPGTFRALADMSAEANYLALHSEDANGVTHGFRDAEVGDYIEIVDMDNPDVYALYVLTSEPAISGLLIELPVRLKDRGADFEIGDSCTIRQFTVNEENINLSELDERYVNVTGGVMTGTLTTPRMEMKKESGEAVMLVEGKLANQNSAARITMSNKINASAYGSLTFHGQNSGCWFQFNKDIDMNGNGVHTVTRIRFSGEKAIQDGNKNRILLNGNVVIPKAGDSNVAGFTVKGKTNAGNNDDMLYVYHNANSLDAVNYAGKQNAGSDNLATCKYVDNKVESAGGSAIPEWTLAHFSFDIEPGKMAFCDGDYNGTNRLEAAQGVVFSAIDANGNRVGRTKDGVDWERDFGGALNILYDEEKTLLSMARSHGSVPSVIYYMAEFDAYMIIWPADKDAVVTSNITHVVQDQNYKIHCPEIFF